jgi:pimeloyl-ACP methyl ester carboxylesterase
VGRWIQHHVMSHENPASRQPLRYKTLEVPTLLLWGADDPVVPPNEGQHITTLMPTAVLSTLLDALGVMAPTLPAAAQAGRIGASLR